MRKLKKTQIRYKYTIPTWDSQVQKNQWPKKEMKMSETKSGAQPRKHLWHGEHWRLMTSDGQWCLTDIKRADCESGRGKGLKSKLSFLSFSPKLGQDEAPRGNQQGGRRPPECGFSMGVCNIFPDRSWPHTFSKLIFWKVDNMFSVKLATDFECILRVWLKLST